MSSAAQIFDSRQSMKNKTFEVFHYLDKKPGSVGVHHHNFYEIYLFLGGKVDFMVEGRTYRLEPGDLLLLNPRELHQPRILSDEVYERMVLWIDSGYLTGLCDSETDLAACFDDHAPNHTNLLRPSKICRASLEQLLDKLHQESYSQALGAHLYARGLLLAFLVEVNRLARKSSVREPRSSEPDLISQVLAYIAAHYQENITLERLAREFYVSKYHLAHEFSNRVGTSVYRYVIFRRLLQARELMETGHSPGEVYQSCGFGDYANFYRAFKSAYGVGPRAFMAGEKGEASP